MRRKALRASTILVSTAVLIPATLSIASHAAATTPVHSSSLLATADRTPDAALSAAESTGQPQVVTSLTTPTTQVTAQPSGDFVATTSVLPTRAQTATGSWVPVDTTMTQQANGSWAPNATAYGSVSFSGGGPGPLVTMTSQGATLSFTWPTNLPTPTANGDTLTYAAVLPGVDLTVNATAAGGFSDVLVVHTAAAAADPGLSALKLGIAASGASISADPGGGLVATAHGETIFDSPVARMWDSTSVPLSASGGSAQTQSSSPSVTPDVPSDTAPGLFANQAVVGVTTNGTTESIAPNTALLTSASTVFPVYIDPTWSPRYTSSSHPAFDEVKQGSPCDTQSYYDDAGSDADNGQLGVGYNGWGGGCVGHDAAFYQFAFPAAAKGAAIISATLNATEVYSATCATTAYSVDITATGGINSGTDWDNMPGSAGSQYNSSTNVGPACTSNPVAGFDATAAVAHVESVGGTQNTFELYEPMNYTDLALKRFADNPTLQVEYDHTPAVPSAGQMSMSSGSTTDACITAAPFPYMGKTASTSPPKLNAKVSDPDGDQIAANFTYWNTAKPATKYTATSANTASGGTASYTLPTSFITGLGATATVAYAVTVTDGHATSAGSVNCQVIIDATAPDAPTVTSTAWPNADTGGSVGAAAGTTNAVTFSSSSTTAKFIYQLTTAPATSNPPASTLVTASSGSATVQLTPHEFGLNNLYVYSEDAAGNIAGPTDYQFLTADNAPVTYPSLSAAYNGTFISPDTAPTEGNLGHGYSFSATDLTNAGWTSGGTVTIDGANLTLPSYGSGQADNVATANQTITINDPQDTNSGQYANALVVLGFSVYSNIAAPSVPNPRTASPYLAANSLMAASCPDTNDADCAQKGSIQYGTGTAGAYQMEMPDWAKGTRDIAAYYGTKVNTPSGSSTTYKPALYPIVIPLDPTRQVTSITLPDLSGAVDSIGTPTLHIVAMGLRNTTTAAAPAGQTWTGSWAEPIEKTVTGGSNYTIRTAIDPTVSGGSVRIKLDNTLGSGPISLSHATIATASGAFSAGTPSSTPTTLTFGGGQGVTIPEGGEAYSDPLPFTVTAGTWLDVSYAITNTNATLPAHTFATDAYTLMSANNSGDHTTDSTATAFTAATTPGTSELLTGLDVATSTNTPTAAVIGDQLINATAAGSDVEATPGDPNLASQLAINATLAGSDGYLNAGIESNQLATDAAPNANGGPAALTRLDRDILDQPNIGTVIITEGLQDLLDGTSEQQMLNYYTALQQQLTAFGINIIYTSITPCGGNSACTSAIENSDGTSGSLDELNTAIPGFANYQTPSPGLPGISYVNINSNLSNGATPPQLAQFFNSGDFLNLINGPLSPGWAGPSGYSAESFDILAVNAIYPNAN